MLIRDFPFLCVTTDNFPRPWLPIKIVNPHTNLIQPTFGLIDTGADECSVPAFFAPILGHDLNRGVAKQISTAGGMSIGYSHTTRIEILNLKDELLYTINDTPIDFMPGLHCVLLGVRQFLDIFDLYIKYPHKTFSVKIP